MKTHFIICFFVLGLALCCEAQGQMNASKCTTPNGIEGTCTNIRECTPILDYIRKNLNNSEALAIVRRSLCSNESSEDKKIVCCPSESGDLLNRQDLPNGDRSTQLLEPPNCGRTAVDDHVKIQGGDAVVLGAWPWIAALGYNSLKKTGTTFLCSGSLINKRYVVTAAHCVSNPNYKLIVVRLGELDLNANVSDGASPLDFGFEKITAHPEYDSQQRINDIALIKLNQDVKFTDYIQPICLPKAPELRSNNFVRKNPFTAGWGKLSMGGPSSTRLMEVQVPIVKNEDCRRSYSKQGMNISEKQLCAGYVDGGKDACLGDSGGPLMLPQKMEFFLVGVISYGYRCGEPGYPGVYTRVTEYIDWVSSTIT